MVVMYNFCGFVQSCSKILCPSIQADTNCKSAMEGCKDVLSSIDEGVSQLLKKRDEGENDSEADPIKNVRPAFRNDHGAFISYFNLLPTSSKEFPTSTPLAGLTFAVKDIFDVEGQVTGFGTPDWARTHGPARRNARAVQLLLDAGAICIGKVHMDEMAYSILGENYHYGTPVNPAAPSRVPGGSSSGSAVAVAANLVDISLGSDTGGSVRAPASFCGTLGFRPSHGAVSVVGVTPMAQSLDTAGWFASNVSVLRKVGHVLLDNVKPLEQKQPKRFLIADDCFKMSTIDDDKRLGIATNSITNTFGNEVLEHVDLGEYIASNVFSLEEFEELHGENIHGPLGVLDDVLTYILRWEFKMNYEDWVTFEKPSLGADVASRVEKAMRTTSLLMSLALRIKEETRQAINDLLKEDGILVIPTMPGPPPELKAQGEAFEHYREKAFALLSLSVMSSCCQVSIPAGRTETGPVAISFLGRHGSDHLLLDIAVLLHTAVQENANAMWPKP